ncbi:MAG: DUF1109 domain-containing protein [Proteobacteria bacterium]|nr:DUF1109 domain-containing protein [Pseudomonadota bacterium]
MNMQTDDLIVSLAGDARPVRRLAAPWMRLLSWLVVAVPWMVAVVLIMSPRQDLGDKLNDPRWVLEQAAALATALTAAMAAFCSGVPGRPRWEHVLPLPPFALWVGLLGVGCVQTWLQAGPEGLDFRPDWICFPGIVFVGIGPGVAMVAMLRRGAPLAPVLSTALGALAAAALADFGLRFFHAQDASLMVLVWQVGTVVLLTMLAAMAGPYVVRWRHVAGR